MNRRAPKKGRVTRSLLNPANISLITNARQVKSPRKYPYKKIKNTKSKSYGGSLAFGKKEDSGCSGFLDEKTQSSSTASDYSVATPEEVIESASRSRTKRKKSREDKTDLTVRKTKELLTSDNEWHSEALPVMQQNEAGLPKIDNLAKGESNKVEELSNQDNSFKVKLNQPILDCDLNLVASTTDSATKNNRSTHLRNKPLVRELKTHAESLLKLSRSTKLTGTINKGRRNVERQQEKTLRSVTVRKKYPQPTITSPSIKFDKEKKTCSSASLIRKPILRKKMPDFSAIHQENFGKMESIVDHLERKARRAIVLKTSTVKKAKPDLKDENTEKVVEHLKSKAQRALELTPSTIKKVKQDVKEGSTSNNVSKSNSFAVLRQINSKYESPMSTKGNQLKCVQKLDTTFDKIQSNKKVTQENVNIFPKAVTKFDKIQSNKATQENVNILPKSRTKSDQIKTNKTAIKESINILPKEEVSKAKVEDINSRILEKRGLYKGKIEVGGGIRQKKNVEILRGVRSNRRFELQMKYRNNRD